MKRLWSFDLGETRIASYRRILAWWLVSRTVVVGTTLVSGAVKWPRPDWWLSHRLGQPLNVLGTWDGRWYRLVAQRGYIDIPKHQSDTAFFPLYPTLMNAAHSLGVSLSTAGLVLANVGFVVGLLALYELARAWLPEPSAERTATYAALFPLGFVFSMAYPEGVVLAAMAGAGVCAVRRRWTSAAVLAAAATLARPEGLFLVLPLAGLVFRRRGDLGTAERGAAVAAVLAAPAALAAVAVYQQITVGNALAFTRAQRAWGRHFSPFGIRRAVLEVVHATGQNHWIYRDAAFCACYIILLVLAFRSGVPGSWVLAGALIVVLPLESGSFTSDGRFGLLALPVYAGLARVGNRRVPDLVLRLSMLGMLAAGTATVLLRWP
jgi:hypothetical protein